MTQAFATGTIDSGVITIKPTDASPAWDACWEFGATAAEDGETLGEMIANLEHFFCADHDADAAVMGYNAAQWAIQMNIDELQAQLPQYEQ